MQGCKVARSLANYLLLVNCYTPAMPIDPLEPIPSLSKRQTEILLYIGQYFAAHREAPSHTEIREYLGLGERTNVGPYLAPLFKRGYLERANASIKGRMRLTMEGIERIKVILPEKDEYSELEKLIQEAEETYYQHIPRA